MLNGVSNLISLIDHVEGDRDAGRRGNPAGEAPGGSPPARRTPGSRRASGCHRGARAAGSATAYTPGASASRHDRAGAHRAPGQHGQRRQHPGGHETTGARPVQEAHQSEEGAQGEGGTPHLGFLVDQGVGTEEEEDGAQPDEHDKRPRRERPRAVLTSAAPRTMPRILQLRRLAKIERHREGRTTATVQSVGRRSGA